MNTNEHIYKGETDSQQTYGYQGGMMWGRDSQGVWDGHVHIAIFKMDNQQNVLYTAQGTLLNVMWQPGWEESLGENIYIYVYD